MDSQFFLGTALARTHAFLGLDENQLQSVVSIAKIREYQPGDSVVTIAARDCDLYVLLNGLLHVEDAKGTRIAEVFPGAAIGEVALIDQQPRSAEVIVIEPSTIAVIPALDLWSLIDRRPDMGKTILFNIGRVLAGRLRSANAVA